MDGGGTIGRQYLGMYLIVALLKPPLILQSLIFWGKEYYKMPLNVARSS